MLVRTLEVGDELVLGGGVRVAHSGAKANRSTCLFSGSAEGFHG
jgi:hypothetical protein